MPVRPRTHVRDYYDLTPAAANATGDIWSDLPTHGLLASARTNGIVITPACDLANRKVETITYLPIIPLRSYFTTAGFMPDLLSETNRQLAASQTGVAQVPTEFPPDVRAIDSIDEQIQRMTVAAGLGKKEIAALSRARAGLRVLRLVRQPGAGAPETKDLDELFGVSAATKMVDRAVRNSLSLDVHFLPPDDQAPEWSGVQEPSLVLFRYTLSAPVELFEAAQDLQLHDWDGVVDKLAASVPIAAAFRGVRPLKRAMLKAAYAADMITRYVAMFVRLGSPDLSPGTIDECVSRARS